MSRFREGEVQMQVATVETLPFEAEVTALKAKLAQVVETCNGLDPAKFEVRVEGTVEGGDLKVTVRKAIPGTLKGKLHTLLHSNWKTGELNAPGDKIFSVSIVDGRIYFDRLKNLESAKAPQDFKSPQMQELTAGFRGDRLALMSARAALFNRVDGLFLGTGNSTDVTERKGQIVQLTADLDQLMAALR